jgi:ribonuclease HI
MSKVLRIWTDGASKGNPGRAGFGVIIKDENNSVLEEHAQYLGIQTNNVAEWQGFLHAIRRAVTLGSHSVTIYTDSRLVAKQFIGEFKIKDAGLRFFATEARAWAKDINQLNVIQVPREENREADALANRGALSG